MTTSTLQVKGFRTRDITDITDDDDGTISDDMTGTRVATCSTYGETSRIWRTDISDKSKVRSK